MTIEELEKTAANKSYQSDVEFMNLVDIVIVDYLAFMKHDECWSTNIRKDNGEEEHMHAHTIDELEVMWGVLLTEALNGKIIPIKDVSLMTKYRFGIDEVLISLYYTDPLEGLAGRPRATTISSTTTFGLEKELIPVDKIREKYGAASERTGKDPLELIFKDNKIPFRPADMFKDHMPRYNLNLKYLVEAAKLARA